MSPTVDHAGLVESLRAVLRGLGARVRSLSAPAVALAGRGEGPPVLVHADELGAELGPPGTRSESAVLLTREVAALHDGRLSLVGPEPADGEAHPFAQLVLTAATEQPDPFQLHRTRRLDHRLPGYMVRATPDRLWARVSRARLAGGFDLATLGGALVAAYRDDHPALAAVEVVLATDPEAVEALRPVVAAARLLARRAQRLVLQADGAWQCLDGTCETCDDRPVCEAALGAIRVLRGREEARAASP